MNITTRDESGVHVLTVGNQRIDASVAIKFKDRMREETNGKPGRFVLDLSNVTFIDSSGLGAVVASLKQLQDGQSLDLSGLSPTVDKVFRLTRMDSVFAIHRNLDAALGGTT